LKRPTSSTKIGRTTTSRTPTPATRYDYQPGRENASLGVSPHHTTMITRL
jgi:hypothetical protein